MTSTRAASGSAGGLFPLFFGVLGPPIIWAVRIGISYILVPYACWTGWVLMLHLVTLAGLAGTAYAGWTAWGCWRWAGKGTEVELGGATTRSRFMALFAMLSSGFFFLVIVAEGLANFFVNPCQVAGAPLG